MMLGDSLFKVPRSAVSRAEASAAPTASQMSTLSLFALALHLRTPSAGLGASHPSPRQAMVDITNHPACPLPHRLVPTEVPLVIIPVSHPMPSTSSPVTGPAATPSCSSIKRPAANVVTPAYTPLKHCPSNWPTYEWCHQHKSKCCPPVKAKPPYDTCSVCLNLRQPCKLGSVKSQHALKA